jgi:hypothetical protein
MLDPIVPVPPIDLRSNDAADTTNRGFGPVHARGVLVEEWVRYDDDDCHRRHDADHVVEPAVVRNQATVAAA